MVRAAVAVKREPVDQECDTPPIGHKVAKDDSQATETTSSKYDRVLKIRLAANKTMREEFQRSGSDE
jgi:hypothetical protein